MKQNVKVERGFSVFYMVSIAFGFYLASNLMDRDFSHNCQKAYVTYLCQARLSYYKNTGVLYQG